MIALENKIELEESFRDSISTVTKEGKRNWIYPQKPSGKLYTARTIVSIFFLALMFSGPFIKVNGHPLMLFNILERKFILFGIVFFPQDFFLFGLTMLTILVFIILFTAMFGRLWCGWACPQTIFMEMIFRKIEYLIEGNYIQQKTLNSSTLSPEKFIKKTLKHIIFFSLSFLIANTFLAYIIGIDELTTIITDNPLNHKAGLISIFVFTGVFYAVYARFREQACIVVCPYGRLQGVLLDSNSVVIGYDYKRGEPRAKLRKNEERSAGDCIDCHQCVQVCPTGIDIRNGTQLECINCTACIDACNTIMGRIKKPLGLIRYTSENSISKREKFKITPRIIAYSAILFILLAALSVLFASRESLETTILRTPGLLYQEVNNDQISNLYNIKIVNKTFNNMNIQLRLDSPEGEIKWVGNPVEIIKSESIAAGVFFIIISKSEIQKVKTPVNISIISDGKIINRVKTSIMGPNI